MENGVKKARLTLDYYNEPFGSSIIDNYVNSGKPVIVYSKKFYHRFIIDNKVTNTYTVKDPYWYLTKTLNDNDNSLQHVRGYNNYFDSVNLFSYLETPKPITASIFLYLGSPAELLVTDPLGRKLGKDPIANTIYNGIPDGSYTKEGPIVTSDTPLDPNAIHETKVIYLPTPIDGKYDVQVIGIDTGSYTVELLAYDQNGQSENTVQKGDTATNAIQGFELDYSKDTAQETVLYRTVNIDIKPGSYPNSINLKSKGVTPVAILTDKFFNAKDVIVDSVVFAGAKPLRGNLEDVNNDNNLDLILHFDTQSLKLNPTDTEAILTARLNDGSLIKGKESVKIVNK